MPSNEVPSFDELLSGTQTGSVGAPKVKGPNPTAPSIDELVSTIPQQAPSPLRPVTPFSVPEKGFAPSNEWPAPQQPVEPAPSHTTPTSPPVRPIASHKTLDDVVQEQPRQPSERPVGRAAAAEITKDTAVNFVNQVGRAFANVIPAALDLGILRDKPPGVAPEEQRVDLQQLSDQLRVAEAGMRARGTSGDSVQAISALRSDIDNIVKGGTQFASPLELGFDPSDLSLFVDENGQPLQAREGELPIPENAAYPELTKALADIAAGATEFIVASKLTGLDSVRASFRALKAVREAGASPAVARAAARAARVGTEAANMALASAVVAQINETDPAVAAASGAGIGGLFALVHPAAGALAVKLTSGPNAMGTAAVERTIRALSDAGVFAAVTAGEQALSDQDETDLAEIAKSAGIGGVFGWFAGRGFATREFLLREAYKVGAENVAPRVEATILGERGTRQRPAPTPEEATRQSRLSEIRRQFEQAETASTKKVETPTETPASRQEVTRSGGVEQATESPTPPAGRPAETIPPTAAPEPPRQPAAIPPEPPTKTGGETAPEAAPVPATTETQNASRIRETEGRPDQGRGAVVRSGAGEGGQNLEQPQPGQPGGQAQQPEAPAGAERQPTEAAVEPVKTESGISFDDPFVKSGSYDEYTVPSNLLTPYKTTLPKGYKIPEFASYDDAQKAYDDEMDRLSEKYGEDKAFKIAIEAQFPESDVNTYAVDSADLAKVRAIRIARDRIGGAEDDAVYAEMVSRLDDVEMSDQLRARVNTLLRDEQQVANIKRAMNLRTSRGEVESTVGRIYGLVAQDLFPGADMLANLSDALKAERMGPTGWRDLGWGRSAQPALDKAREIAKALIGPPFEDSSFAQPESRAIEAAPAEFTPAEQAETAQRRAENAQKIADAWNAKKNAGEPEISSSDVERYLQTRTGDVTGLDFFSERPGTPVSVRRVRQDLIPNLEAQNEPVQPTPAQVAPETGAEAPPAIQQAQAGAPEAAVPNAAEGQQVTPEVTARRDQAAEAVRTRPSGSSGTAYTPKNREVKFRYRLVDAGDPLVSNRDDLTVDPAYPAEFQPRDRTRAASKEQVDSIARNPVGPRLAESAEAGDGAPIIGPDGVVESGNGRVIGLRRAYEEGNAEDYRSWLKENAGKYGIEPSDVDALDRPVLVRERTTEMDDAQRREFVRELNEPSRSGYSPTEQAKIDAQRISPALMEALQPAESGDLNAASNREFVRGFMRSVVPQTEHGDLMDENGALNKDGLDRLKNAIVAKAYDDPRLEKTVAEAIDDNVRSVTNALVARAADWAQIRRDMEAGVLPEMNPIKPILDAAVILQNARKQGQTAREYLDQAGLFGDDPVLTRSAVEAFGETFKGSTPKITQVLRRYAELVRAQPSPQAGMLFAGADETAQMNILFRQAVDEVKTGRQVDLFGSPRNPANSEQGLVSRAKDAGYTVRRVPENTRNFTDKGYRYNIRNKDGASLWAKSVEEGNALLDNAEKWNAEEKKVSRRAAEGGPQTFGSPKQRLANREASADAVYDDDATIEDVESLEQQAEPIQYGDDSWVHDKVVSGFEKGSVSREDVRQSMIDLAIELGQYVPLRRGRIRSPQAEGEFNPHTMVARIRSSFTGVGASVHELMHGMAQVAWGSPGGRGLRSRLSKEAVNEIMRLGRALYGDKQPQGGYFVEGLAQWGRAALGADAQQRTAAQIAPKATQEIEHILFDGHARLRKAWDVAKGKIETYSKEGARRRQLANQGKPRGWFKQRAHNAAVKITEMRRATRQEPALIKKPGAAVRQLSLVEDWLNPTAEISNFEIGISKQLGYDAHEYMTKPFIENILFHNGPDGMSVETAGEAAGAIKEVLDRDHGWWEIRRKTQRRRIANALRPILAKAGFDQAAQKRAIAETLLGRTLPSQIMRAWNQTATNIVDWWVRNGVKSWQHGTVSRPLEDAFALVAGKEEEWGVYLHAVHALDIHEQNKAHAGDKDWEQIDPGDMSEREAQAILEDLTPEEAAIFDDASQILYDWTKASNNAIIDIAPENMRNYLTKFLTKWGHYVPLNHVLPDDARRTAAAVKGNPLKKLHGSSLAIMDPVTMLQSNRIKLLQHAYEARAIGEAISWANTIPGLGQYIEEIPADVIGQKVPIEQIAKDLEKLLGVEIDEKDKAGVVTFFQRFMRPHEQESIISIPDGDDVRYYWIDPELADAFNNVMALQRLPDGSSPLGMIGRISAMFTRMRKIGLTIASPTYTVARAPFVDIPGAFARTDAAAPIFAWNLAKWFGGVLTPKQFRPKELQAHMDFLKGNGIDISNRFGTDIAQIRREQLGHGRERRSLFDPRGWPRAFVDAFRGFVGGEENIFRGAETEARFKELGLEVGPNGEYPTLSLAQQMYMIDGGRHIIMDWPAVGLKMKKLNQHWAYASVPVVSAYDTLKGAKRHPLKFFIALMSIAALRMWLWDKFKDQQWLKELPFYDRFMYQHYGDGLRMRMDDIMSIPAIGFEAFAQQMYDSDPEIVGGAIRHMIEGNLPLVSFEAPYIDWPTALQPFMETLTNRRQFSGSPTVPERIRGLQPGGQFTPHTAQWAKRLGELYPDTFSPAKWEYIVNSYIGTLGRDVISLESWLSGVAGMPELALGLDPRQREQTLADVPITEAIWRRGGEAGTQSRSVNRLYEHRRRLESIEGRADRELTKEQKDYLKELRRATELIGTLRTKQSTTFAEADRQKIQEDIVNAARSTVRDEDAARPILDAQGRHLTPVESAAQRARLELRQMRAMIRFEDKGEETPRSLALSTISSAINDAEKAGDVDRLRRLTEIAGNAWTRPRLRLELIMMPEQFEGDRRSVRDRLMDIVEQSGLYTGSREQQYSAALNDLDRTSPQNSILIDRTNHQKKKDALADLPEDAQDAIFQIAYREAAGDLATSERTQELRRITGDLYSGDLAIKVGELVDDLKRQMVLAGD